MQIVYGHDQAGGMALCGQLWRPRTVGSAGNLQGRQDDRQWVYGATTKEIAAAANEPCCPTNSLLAQTTFLSPWGTGLRVSWLQASAAQQGMSQNVGSFCGFIGRCLGI